jgi:hypothetical protein
MLCVDGLPARKAYELRVAELSTDDQTRHTLVNVFSSFLLGPLGGRLENIPGAVELHIVDLRNGNVVASMKAGEDASSLAKLIATDLDRLDAEDFATEWGIDRSGLLS